VAAELLVVGLSHRTAELEVREKLAVPEDELEQVVTGLTALPELGEALLVSTCNRVEVFATTSGAGGAGGANAAATAIQAVRRFLAESRGVAPERVGPHLYDHVGPAAVKHMFRVASSLDSLVVGEPQILGQLKEAAELAARAGCVGPLLGRCLERAFGVAKRVRTETAIARGSASVSSVAVDLAKNIFGELSGKAVLVIGAGKMADLAARKLADEGASSLWVTNRTAARAEALAARVGGEARPFAELETLLGRADIVISSTGAPQPIIRRDLMKRVNKARKHRSIFLIDIAVPRDVEPTVGKLDGVYLFDVDDLERVVADNLKGRFREAEAGERIVEAEAAQFLAWQRQQGVVPTIKDLRERFGAVARAEAEKTLAQLGGAGPIGERTEKAVRQLAESIINKLLHTPLMTLKAHDGDDAEALVAAARRLFALTDAEQRSGGGVGGSAGEPPTGEGGGARREKVIDKK
jgi:glutamyl-tRNA reductase